MTVTATSIPGLLIIAPDVFSDARGYFEETYNAARYRAAGIDAEFVQDNESLSQKGVLRGLHWQSVPHTQAKLVRVVRGAVWDVAVDIRAGSPTFGKYESVVLSAENHRQFFIPHGFAHGFLVLEDNTLFSYKCDNFYDKASERGLAFDDSTVGISWPDLGIPYLRSEKDLHHPGLDAIVPVVLA